jgi:hypothetical protein
VASPPKIGIATNAADAAAKTATGAPLLWEMV